MIASEKQTQRTFLQQECYLPILFETFLTARKAVGLSKHTLKYYREKLTVFLAFYEAQAVTQIQDVTADLLRRFMLKLAETHNQAGSMVFIVRCVPSCVSSKRRKYYRSGDRPHAK